MAVTAFSAKNFKGKWKTMWFAKKASVVIVKGTPVEFETGYVKQATTTAGATDTPLAGIYNGPTTASTDADYASNTLVPVLVPDSPNAEVQLTCVAIAQADVGKSFDINSDSVVTGTGGTSSNEPVTCTGVVSATEGMFVLTTVSSPAA